MTLPPARWALSPPRTATPGLWRGCVAAVPMFWGELPPVDLIRNARLAVFGSGASLTVTEQGRANHLPSATVSGWRIPQAWLTSQTITIAAWLEEPGDDNSTLFNQGPSQPASILFRRDVSEINLLMRKASDASSVSIDTLFSPVEGRRALWGAQFDGDTLGIRHDGVLSASGSMGEPRKTNGGDLIVFSHPSVAGAEFRTPVSYVVAWDRLLSDGEWALLARDPFVMFRPARRTLFVAEPPGAIITLDGVASTGAAGVTGATGGASIALSGVQATSAQGVFTALGGATILVPAVSSDGQAGTITVSTAGGVTVTLSGVSASGASGDMAPASGAVVALSGDAATGLAGMLGASGAANINLTGVAATGETGSITIGAGDISVILSGVNAAGQIGDISVSGGAQVSVSGAESVAGVGTVVTVAHGSGRLVATITITPALSGSVTIN